MAENSEELLSRPYNVMDVANYVVEHFIRENQPISNLLLQKILYYLQAYFLVQKDGPLFRENIEKWGYGPVEPAVYSYFKENGASPISSTSMYIQVAEDNSTWDVIEPEDRKLESEDEKDIDNVADKIFEDYHNDPFKLVEFTHNEPMWNNHRSEIEKGTRHLSYSKKEIIDYFKNDGVWPWEL